MLLLCFWHTNCLLYCEYWNTTECLRLKKKKERKCALYFVVRDCNVCDCSNGPSLSRTSRMHTSSCTLGKATLPGSEKNLFGNAKQITTCSLNWVIIEKAVKLKGNVYCIGLHCIVLYCIVLYCIVLYCEPHCSAELLFVTVFISMHI